MQIKPLTARRMSTGAMHRVLPGLGLCLAVTAVANTSANRRFTFGVHERTGAARHQLQGLGIFLLGLAVTSGSLSVLHTAAPDAGHLLELSVLVSANLVATVLRFVLLRSWVFRRTAPADGR